MPETLGIIGGTGLGEALATAGGQETVWVDTPFGPPSAELTVTDWNGHRVVFLPRHGRGHVLPPGAVPYRANIFALKSLGVSRILASGATGSLREHIAPGHLVIPDQVIDRTHARIKSFFADYLAAHVELSEPFCPALRGLLLDCARTSRTEVHEKGVYVCMEGPQFSTRAESHMHRHLGGDLIGMTCMPEARLAREAEMCYALVALPTDYDCWRPHDVTAAPDDLLREIGANLSRGTELATALIHAAVGGAATTALHCGCQSALRLGMWSDPAHLDRERLRPLRPLLEKYLDFDG